MTQPSLMFLHVQIIPNQGASSFDVDNCFLETRNLSVYISFMCSSTDYVDETMRASEADVLINAAKTFVLFSPENERVISPEGAK